MQARPDPARLLAHLLADDPDAALAAGLMDYRPLPGDEHLDSAHPELPQRLLAAQARLREAWDARARYRQRNARLARRAAERDARRAPAPAPDRPATPALPPAAAALLARAKARAAGRDPA